VEKQMYGFTIEELDKGRYKISGKYIPDDMVVTVKKDGNRFRASCNYSKWERGADNPYQAIHPHDTEQRSLEGSLIYLSISETTSPEDFCWVDEKRKYVVRSNGKKIPYKDFQW
jgi:hypothetical protein